MSNSTNTKHTDLLRTQSNVEETHNKKSSTNVVQREPVEGTPFTIAKNDKGYTLLMGLYALTPTFKTKTALKSFWQKQEWNIIINMLHAMLDFHKLINNKPQNNERDTTTTN